MLLVVGVAGPVASPALAQFLGLFGPETRITLGTRANEKDGRGVALASDAAGRFVAVWAYAPTIAATHDVYLRRYDAGGVSLSDEEARVNAATSGDQVQPAVAMAPDGRFVVAWSGPGDVGNGIDVFVRRYDASGTPQLGETRVNVVTNGDQVQPAVAMSADGSFVVAWVSVTADFTTRIVARRYHASGTALTDELDVASFDGEALFGIDVAASPSGSFVVVFSVHAGASEQILGRRYDANGAPATQAPFPITSPESALVRAPSVGVAPDGRFVVAWQRAPVGGTYDVLARRYTSQGAADAEAFPVNTTAALDQAGAAVAVGSDGAFVIAWSGNGELDADGVYLRRYAANGTAQGDELRANSTLFGDQSSPSVAMNATGNFVVAWTGTDEHAFFQRFLVNNPPVVTLAGTALTYVENAGPILVDGAATVRDVDSANFQGGSLSVALTPHLLGDELAIRDQGVGDGQIGSNGTTVTYSGQEIGSIGRVPGSPSFIVNLNERATPAAVEALLRNVTFENERDDFPAGSRTVTVAARDGDGETSANATRTISLVPVADAPVAGHNAYSVAAGTPLSVHAPGVLQNDTDADSPSLQASLVTGPNGGSLTLDPSGAFTYTPAAGFSGTDRFTYRATDGALTSELATATLTVEPAACAPRPPVTVEARPTNGALAVTIAAQRNTLTPNNALVTVAVGDATNATVEVPAQAGAAARSGTGSFEVALAPNTTELRIIVRRRALGAVHVPLVVTDGCPAWRTFVGGGATAF